MLIVLLLGVMAAMISGQALTTEHPPVAPPKDHFELPMAMVGGGPVPENVQITPQSEFKFKHIVRQAYDYSCGSAALVTVLNFHLGLPISEQAAMEGMLEKGEKEKIIARRGFSLLDMKRYVASLGVQSNGFRAEVKDLLALEHPAIVPIDYGGFKHFVVLRGVREGKAYIADPSAGHIVFGIDDFAKLWDRNTLFLIYPPKDQPPVRLLALSDQELGVMDMDRVGGNAVLAPLDRTDQLGRAAEAGFGGTYFRRH
jgi:predicted double-glycine peptidase